MNEADRETIKRLIGGDAMDSIERLVKLGNFTLRAMTKLPKHGE